MLYGVEVTHSIPDYYGFPKRTKSLVMVDARNKRQARRLVREHCIIQEWRQWQVGKAALNEGK